MSDRRTCCDNAVVERFINLLKRERPSGEKNTKNAKQLGANSLGTACCHRLLFNIRRNLNRKASGKVGAVKKEL